MFNQSIKSTCCVCGKEICVFLHGYINEFIETPKIDIPFKDKYTIFDLDKKFKENNILFCEVGK